MKTPVVIFIYKRSHNLEKLFSVLSILEPDNLFIIADGPKNLEEAEVVKNTRQLVESLISWKCKVQKNYSKTNLGLKIRFKTGINWVFEYCDRAIFLEDDCVPDITFFKFCEELLDKYDNNPQIMTISGNNFQFGRNTSLESYHFSIYPHIWGWATWKHAWKDYDSDIADWPNLRKTNWLRSVLGSFIIAKFWKYIFDGLYLGKINTWDYQIAYASFKTGSLHIVPNINLVSNVGFGIDSTNIKHKNKTLSVPTKPMQFPLMHPNKIIANKLADSQIENLVYLHPIGKISLLIKSLFGLI